MMTTTDRFQPPGQDERGAALVVTLFLITTLTILGVIVLNTSIVEIKMANNQKISSQAFYAAEAGLERGLATVMRDFEQDTGAGAPWGNNTFAGADTVTVSFSASGPAFDATVRSLDMYLTSPAVKRLSYSRGGNTVGRAAYGVYVYSSAATPNEVFVLSYATQPDAVAAVEYHLKVDDVSPYNNAIFAGSGVAGTLAGNISVHGSVFDNGNLSMTGTCDLTNNYADGQAITVAEQAMIPTETDLHAKVRVKGTITLGGSAKIGEAGGGTHNMELVSSLAALPGSGIYSEQTSNTVPNVPMPTVLDGLRGAYGDAFINSYYSGTDQQKAETMYNDLIQGQGPFAPTGSERTSQGAVIPGNITITAGTTNSFSYSDRLGNGLFWDKAAGVLKVKGMVKINGTLILKNNVTFTAEGPNASDSMGNRIIPAGADQVAMYQKGALLYATGNVEVWNNFTPASGGYLKPSSAGNNLTNSLAICTPGNVTFDRSGGGSSQTIAGYFYGYNGALFQKQMHVLGTVVAGTVTTGQVPDVYQVPSLKNYLPPTAPGCAKVLQFTGREWRRVY